MKNIVTLLILICTTIIPFSVSAEVTENPDFEKIFCDHGSVMLLIEPQTGSILYANSAAAVFYGYTKEQLESMMISQINTLTPEETAQEMQAAKEEDRNYFIFKHRLANGEIRTVEVFSYPSLYSNQDVLFSIVHDITAKTLLEEKNKKLSNMFFISGGLIILLLLSLLGMLSRSHNKLKERTREIENFNELRRSFIDAEGSLIYLKDENLNYVFINKATAEYYKKTPDEIIGSNDLSLSDHDFALIRRQTDLKVLEKGTLIDEEVKWDNRVYRTTKFPVKMLNGKFGVGAYIKDVTKERELIRRQKKVLQRHILLVNVLNHSFDTKQEQLDYVLNESLKLTESKIGYIYLYDEEKKEFILNSWSNDVMAECKIVDKQTKYRLENTGIWGEVVRQRKPIVVNNFQAPHPLKKGYPEGHVQLRKYMSIPVMIEEKIVAVLGLANKDEDYDDNDVYEMTILMNGVWNAVERKDALDKLSYERNKYLQTLISIGDAVMVVNSIGRIEMLNIVAQKLTGWSIEEASGRHYKEVLVLSHENEKLEINDPIQDVLKTDSIQELGNHAMLTARNGTRYYLEDSAAPIKDDTGATIGVVLVFRDITEKKEQRKTIEFLSFHDPLTGLYNRRFFEEEIKRLDTERNLPISFIMGDVNGLKLINDIFGHSYGDMLLKKFAEVLRRVCRADDIVARWGGDEFVLLLPKTSLKEAERIKARIKNEFSRKQIKSIKGSISMGCGIRQGAEENIIEALEDAEEKMYAEKTLERYEFVSSAIETIISSLHENNIEKEHAVRVSELCEQLGKTLQMPEAEIRRLKDAGFLHDIGKIVLEPKLLNKKEQLSSQEWTEVKRHPIVGYRILNSFDNTMDLAEPVLAHHEQWDGLGYPKGLKGDEIPKLARIIAVTEYYDRLMRCQDKGIVMSKEEAIRTIQENAGIKFDPEISNVFIAMLKGL